MLYIGVLISFQKIKSDNNIILSILEMCMCIITYIYVCVALKGMQNVETIAWTRWLLVEER
jgi:hypothetical protein